jgi:hypothetical protein
MSLEQFLKKSAFTRKASIPNAGLGVAFIDSDSVISLLSTDKSKLSLRQMFGKGHVGRSGVGSGHWLSFSASFSENHESVTIS